MKEEIINGINYRLDEETLTAEVIQKDDYRGDIIIPDAVVFNEITYRVTSIGDFAFRCCSELLSITIPNSVTSIGAYAFEGCFSLALVTIPNSVTSIGKWAFAGCSSLTSITIPNSVTSIGKRAFAGCSSLESIVVDSGNTVYDSRNNSHAIIESASNTLVWGCPNTIIPNTITRIDDYAFLNCPALTSISIPDSVKSIGCSAFEGCKSLTSITFQGTIAQWKEIEFGEDWIFHISTNIVHCIDGDVEI